MENGYSTNTAGSATNRSGRWSCRQPASSPADNILCVCACGREVVMRTSWTSINPGRRFRGCPGSQGTYCGTFEWIDPPMCLWSKEVIPSLLNRLNQFELGLKRAKERVEQERARGRRSMEKTFVDALLQQAQRGNFTVGMENRTAQLQQRHEFFNWLVTRPDVICNRTLRFVTAPDTVWREIVRLFALPAQGDNAPENATAVDAGNQVVPEVPAAVDGDVDVSPNVGNDVIEIVNIPSNSFRSSDSLWKFIDAYYASDSDADSVLPPPGVPFYVTRKKFATPEKSPTSGSPGLASSSASNATPIKKQD
ncbi:hypothetical protein Salat_1100400 [Sesamum alatum]|uniref:GRF-type domain-containing protein n=1 Tax=Sesamum alatum TaxID=300844 RepID=A0AAE1YP57_9LAMI|nr:hypothetical protein Salat_1100400 [Sesamum alatum]